MVVGRRWASSRVGEAFDLGNFDPGNWWGENTELGPVGNILASQDLGIVSFILIVQQHCTVNSHSLIPLTADNTLPATSNPSISTSV